MRIGSGRGINSGRRKIPKSLINNDRLNRVSASAERHRISNMTIAST